MAKSADPANPNYVMRLGSNPPVSVGQTPAQAIAAPSNGLATLNSLYYQGIGGFAISSNYKTPYIQNWKPDHNLAGDPHYHHRAHLRGRQGHASLHAAPEPQPQECAAAQRAE
jgi:hypothetical protein